MIVDTQIPQKFLRKHFWKIWDQKTETAARTAASTGYLISDIRLFFYYSDLQQTVFLKRDLLQTVFKMYRHQSWQLCLYWASQNWMMLYIFFSLKYAIATPGLEVFTLWSETGIKELQLSWVSLPSPRAMFTAICSRAASGESGFSTAPVNDSFSDETGLDWAFRLHSNHCHPGIFARGENYYG